MKKLLFVAALMSSSAMAKESANQSVLDVQKSSINQYILVNGLEGAFKLPGKPGAEVKDIQKCVLAGTARSALLTLRALNYNDADISELIELVKPHEVALFEHHVAEAAQTCGSLF